MFVSQAGGKSQLQTRTQKVVDNENVKLKEWEITQSINITLPHESMVTTFIVESI